MASLCVSPIVLAWPCNGQEGRPWTKSRRFRRFFGARPFLARCFTRITWSKEGVWYYFRQKIENREDFVQFGGKAGGSAERPADRRKSRRIGGKAGGQSSQGASSGRGQNPSVAVEGWRRGRSQDAGEGGTAALRLSCFPRGGIGLRPLIAGEARLLAVGIDDGRPSSRWSASGDKSWVAGIKGAACVRENKASEAKGGAPSVERDVGFRRRWGVVGLRRKRGLLACARSRSRHVAETDGRAPCCGHRSG